MNPFLEKKLERAGGTASFIFGFMSTNTSVNELNVTRFVDGSLMITVNGVRASFTECELNEMREFVSEAFFES